MSDTQPQRPEWEIRVTPERYTLIAPDGQEVGRYASLEEARAAMNDFLRGLLAMGPPAESSR